MPPLTMLLRKFPAVGPLLAEPVIHRGFSGAVVWEVASATGRFALRRWPPGWKRDRLVGLHELLRFLRVQGLGFVAAPLPAFCGDALLLHEGSFWQLEPWLPGQADYHQHPSRTRLAATMTDLARWHLHAVRFQPRGHAATWFSSHANHSSPAVRERLNRLNSFSADRLRQLAEVVIAQQKPGFSESRASRSKTSEVSEDFGSLPHSSTAKTTSEKPPRHEGHEESGRSDSTPTVTQATALAPFGPPWFNSSSDRAARHSEMPGFGTLVIQLAELVSRHSPTVRKELELAAQTTVPVQPVLRDVWHDHVLFTGDDVTGLIDASACRTESVSADLARLLGSLLEEDDREGWDFALTAYQRVRALSVAELALIPVLDRSSTLLSAVTWLEWLGPQQRVSTNDPRVRPRLEQLAQRLEGFERLAMTELWQSVRIRTLS